tara:strand:- start:253 stop:1158 length:906 start_codon:yes stop_codon:yes gene_type:complete
MKENPSFLPKSEILSFEQIERLCDIFIEQGVKKIRLTGGEPLVRKDIIKLINNLGKKINRTNLKELTLTTNGTLLEKYADKLAASGIKRINVSLDTLDPIKYTQITRNGDISKVLRGIDFAIKNNINVKINVVALKNFNDNEFSKIIEWCGKKKIDVTFIEVMPMGETEHHRFDQYLPLKEIRENLKKEFNLIKSDHKTGGPARYDFSEKYNIKVGFITPLSQNFCDDCNRIRITCTGRLYMCLGQEKFIDFKKYLNNDYSNKKILEKIKESLAIKPKGHQFIIDENSKPYLNRFMNTTGG